MNSSALLPLPMLLQGSASHVSLLSRVLNGSAGINAEMDIRLSKALGTTQGIWYTMQANFDLRQAQKTFRGKVRAITAVAQAFNDSGAGWEDQQAAGRG